MEERKKATKAIILARVSTKDQQEEGFSIDAQKYRLQEYCTRKGLEVLKVFEFSESSTVGNRAKFLEAIDFAKKQREITAIVVDKVDRLQRSYKETPLLNALVEKEKIELHFCTENCVIHKNSTSQDRMMWNIFVMMVQNYIDSLRDNVNRSIAQKLREGKWISTAPIGYLHINNGSKYDRGKSEIVVDKMRAPLIKRMFEEYATGNCTVPHLTKKIKEWGLRNSRGNKGNLCKSHVHSILRNPFYYGVMRVKKTGKEYPHNYDRLISKDLFDQCQKVRLGWNKKPFKWAGKEYVFRGLIKCAVTGKVVTADTKSKTNANGKTTAWTYLIASDPNNPTKKVFVREEKIIQQVENVFDSMHLEPDVLEQVIEGIRSSAHAEQEHYKEIIKELHAEHTKIQSRMSKLIDLYLDGESKEEDYREKRKSLEQRREEIIKEIESNNRADNNFTETLINALKLASGASEAFKGSNLEDKRELINLVFSNLELKGQKLEFKLRPPFDAFGNCRMAGTGGFEPPTYGTKNRCSTS